MTNEPRTTEGKIFGTLWALTATWPCDSTTVAKEKYPGNASLLVTVHHDLCRKCKMQKHLLLWDERLKQLSESSYEEFAKKFLDAMTEEQFEAIKEHAQFVREEVLGCPE